MSLAPKKISGDGFDRRSTAKESYMAAELKKVPSAGHAEPMLNLAEADNALHRYPPL